MKKCWAIWIGLMLFIFAGLWVSTPVAFAQVQYNGDEKSYFVRVSASIRNSERRNIVDLRNYKSKEGGIVRFRAEFFRRSPEELPAYFDDLISTWTTCSDYEDVIGAQDQKVGKRTICESDSEVGNDKAIIYTYEDILIIISGDSLPTLKRFESETCVRSKLIPGVPCKY